MTLHADSIIVDGLVISNFGRDVFDDMRRGGLTAANCTCCVWENFTESMRNVMRWKTWFREHGDLLVQVYSTQDVRRAKAAGKTGIILGWQNLSGIEDQIGYVQLFKELGVGTCRSHTIRRISWVPGAMNPRIQASRILAAT
jgi:membrane dipeptidase